MVARPHVWRRPPEDHRYRSLLEDWAKRMERWAATRIAAARRRSGVPESRQDASPEDDGRPPPDVWTDKELSAALAAVRAELGGGEMPSPPSPSQIRRAIRRQAQRASAHAQRELVEAGATTRLMRLITDQPFDPTDLSVWAIPKPIAIVLGEGEEQLLTTMAGEGADLVGSYADEWRDTLVAQVEETLRKGQRWEQLADVIAARGGVARSKARFLARDQTAKLNGRLTAALHSKAGITSYVWTSSRDGRVRDSHRLADGKVFTWGDGPTDGAPKVGFYGTRSHPGQAGNCRCTARPVLDDLPAEFGGGLPPVDFSRMGRASRSAARDAGARRVRRGQPAPRSVSSGRRLGTSRTTVRGRTRR